MASAVLYLAQPLARFVNGQVVGTGAAIRVIEVEGLLPLVAAHMSKQPEVREFEGQLEEHLTEPRDVVTPEARGRSSRRRAWRTC